MLALKNRRSFLRSAEQFKKRFDPLTVWRVNVVRSASIEIFEPTASELRRIRSYAGGTP
jgi:hypothetical protein